MEMALVAYPQNFYKVRHAVRSDLNLKAAKKRLDQDIQFKFWKSCTYGENSQGVIVFVPCEVIDFGRVLAGDLQHDFALPINISQENHR